MKCLRNQINCMCSLRYEFQRDDCLIVRPLRLHALLASRVGGLVICFCDAAALRQSQWKWGTMYFAQIVRDVVERHSISNYSPITLWRLRCSHCCHQRSRRRRRGE